MVVTSTGFRPINIGDEKYSLHHLQPKRKVIMGAARDGQDLVLRIKYHSHVFSIEEQGADPQAFIFLDEGRRNREFCSDCTSSDKFGFMGCN